MWYRIKDRAHPLWGLEVCGDIDNQDAVTDGLDDPLLEVRAVRRLDVFVGDRPMTIPRVRGMWLAMKILEESPVQEDIVELEGGLPYGKCQTELSVVFDVKRNQKAQIVVYEGAATVAALADGELLASDTRAGKFWSIDLEETVRAQKCIDDVADAIRDGSIWVKKGRD